MRYLPLLAAALGFCLITSSAWADIATTESGSADTWALSLLQTQNVMIDNASALPGSVALSSSVKSSGPSSTPTSVLGVDSSQGGTGATSAPGELTLANTAALSNTPVTQANDIPAEAAPPQELAVQPHVINSILVTPVDQPSVATLITPQSVIAPVTTIVESPVPIPTSFFLMGAGLLGLLPLRKGSRLHA